MQRIVLFIPAFVLALNCIVAASAQSSNGVWTRPGYGIDGNTGGAAATESNAAKGLAADSAANSNAPAVRAAEVVYDSDAGVELLKISGSNFSPYKENMRVTVDGAVAKIQRSNPTLVTALLPDGLGNKATVVVAVNNQQIWRKEIKLAPRVTGVSLMSGPPGTPLVIYGQRFARNASDNQVTIGGAQAPVNGGSRTTIMTVIPGMLDAQSPTWGIPVTVRVNGMSSNSDVTIRIQNRVY